MKADSLEGAIPNFDPAKKLTSESWEFYVDRDYNPLRDMKTYLLNNKGTQKILFSGHMGSGKSTELNKLMDLDEIKSRFFIVSYSIGEELDPLNLSYIDVLISVGAKIFQRAFEDEIKLDDSTLQYLQNWQNKTKEVTAIDTTTFQGSIAAKINFYFLKLLGKIQREHERRVKIREVVEPQISDLIDAINFIIDGVNLETEKEIIVCIDDLDKPGYPVAYDLFYNRGIPLTQPRCKIIYTIPIDLKCSNEFKRICQIFGENFSLPNVKLTERKTGKPFEPGYDKMKEYVDKRISLNLIQEDALREAIRCSGGVLREMTRIMQNACNSAVSRGYEKVEYDMVELATNKIRNEYRLFLEEKHYALLREFHKTRKLESADKFKDLLYNLSLLEYQDGENWCDVHPIVLPLIKEKKKHAKRRRAKKNK